MSSLRRALPAAIAVLVLALTLGLSSSFVATPDAEAADQPSPVATPYVVDQDSCTTFVYGYNNYPFYGYNPYFLPYQPAAQFPCVPEAFCVGSTYFAYHYLQPYVICPGPPASIEVNPVSATCASATNIQVKVRDANGLNVLATSVGFTVTPFGQITGAVETSGGEATASLTTPTKTAGTLNVTITAGSVTRNIAVDVSCSAPGTVSYGGGGASSSAAVQTTVYTVPSGGSSGGY